MQGKRVIEPNITSQPASSPVGKRQTYGTSPAVISCPDAGTPCALAFDDDMGEGCRDRRDRQDVVENKAVEKAVEKVAEKMVVEEEVAEGLLVEKNMAEHDIKEDTAGEQPASTTHPAKSKTELDGHNELPPISNDISDVGGYQRNVMLHDRLSDEVMRDPDVF
ncbi:hypothetical protein CONLIGDRAFT_719670 [Coniochaeta ligniaria NRRL 30616]|uniref:Uncharacterized protein n=1 Tax=Coniochaeta ligniaria NRRL 30616 TaxID=1408157 RepID=A0A1J7I631_9PEZI|nr:hypothetical protein CONLIGDRAFT_719670 [Coniochaeta ligniaria NRRL 30616]